MFTTYWSEDPVPLGIEPRPLRPAARPLGAGKAPLPAEAGVLAPFGNDRRNSRMPGALGLGPTAPTHYAVRWSAAIPEEFGPYSLLQSANRIVVLGPSLWRLYDVGGSLLHQVPRNCSCALIHPAWTVFYAGDNFGLIAGYRTGSGEVRFQVRPTFGKEFACNFLAARGNRMIAVSIELLIDVHGPDPERSIIEAFDLGDPAFPKSWNEKGGPHVVMDLIRQSRTLYAAMVPDGVAIATVDRVYVLDLDLNFRRAMTGSFLPTEISTDEEGRIYLQVYAEKRNAVWLITPEGERVYSFVFPASFKKPISPPIVGYDHTVYMVSTEHVLSIALDGKLNWMRPGLGTVAGAAVTADDYLLVSEGSNLSAWDARGRRTVLHTFDGDTLSTAPVLMENGDLVVASQQRLYCLTRAPRPN